MEREGKHFLLIGFWPGRRLDCLQLRENLILNLLKEEKNTRDSIQSHSLASFSHKSKVGLLSYHNNYGTRTYNAIYTDSIMLPYNQVWTAAGTEA